MASPNSEWPLRLLAGQAIAREAGVFARARFADSSSFSVGLKGRHDFITEVDGEAEQLIAARLAQCFPGDGFLGEEGGGGGSPEAPLWVVDPIDGTSNFARGAPHFCVSIACILGRSMEVGIIYNPMSEELFTARRGAGAHLNGVAMQTAPTSQLDAAAIEIGWNAKHGPGKFIALASAVITAGAAPCRASSGALGLAYVAAGRRDAYVENFINSWDCLAGNLMVAEAGGYVSDFLAGEGLAKGGPLVACAPGIKDALLLALARAGLAL